MPADSIARETLRLAPAARRAGGGGAVARRRGAVTRITLRRINAAYAV